jgi:acetyl esterase/lipase
MPALGNRRSIRLLIGGLVLALLVLGGSLVRAATVPPAPPPLAQADVTYCTVAGGALKMDIYAPARWSTTPAPVTLFVHGGAWSAGDKADGEGAPEIAELVGRGYVVAAINYRLAPRYVFPAQIEDVKCAVRYLRANAAALHIDPSRIGAWGSSAGGHLVSLLGTADRRAGMEGTGGYARQSSRVQAVVDMFGRADLTGIPQTRPDLLPIFGGAANLVKYSPITYASKGDPPFLILHGDHDTVVPPELSQRFYDRLKAVGVPVTLVMVRNAEHGFVPTAALMTPTRAEITRLVGDFFDHYLKSAGPWHSP